ncbi:G-protein coupled receptor family C group 6 member A-like [Pangasianodon hypophthalmus]|uniref:G-protein coupled receptor family C group 6 member A-like n=1 Tax=Pangasianodon hypophthalmus TaxID=310915 RepID=UPI0023076057|nr:G-protein coupled receptor family C group 6 member A-like [Pangasianodon hypophthalmus]
MTTCVPLLCLYVLGVTMMLGLVAHCDFNQSHFGAYLHGDIVIGILESIHSNIKDLQDRICPEMYTCTDFDQIPFVSSIAAIHTIEEINNSGFLPGIKLGYLMCDPCAYGTKALDCVERMLAVSGPPTVHSDYSNFTSPIKAFLGERYSELSIPVAKLLSLYMIPQISCTSTAPALSDKLRYASFFRVVPSDMYQTQALAKLLRHYSWNWVGVVTIDDEYGRAVLENFVQDAQEEHVCLQFQEVLPNYLGFIHMEEKIKMVADRIESSNATVILLILRPQLVQMLFTEMIKRNISRVWIASDAWSTTGFIMKMKDINKVGDVFGFTFITGEIPGFKGYLQNLRPSPGARNDFISEYKQMSNCTQSQQSENSFVLDCNSYLLQNVDMTQAYGQRVAVYAIAHAIKTLLKCDSISCSGDTNILPWKLISILREIHFTLDNQAYFFNKNGDFENGYDLIMWKKDGDERVPDVVGKFLISNNDVDVYEHKISWFNNTVPESRCSKRCPPGTHKNILNITCCYTCISCSAGDYSDQEDQSTCTKCLNGTSRPASTKCEKWKLGILEWSAAHSIVVIIGTVIGILLLVVSIIFFIKCKDHEIVQNNLSLLCIMQVGLIVSFGSVIAFLGDPSSHQCMVQQAMYGLGFTLSVSCILVNAFSSFLAFMSYDPNRQLYLSKFNKPFVNIGILTVVQGLICLFWFIFDPLKVDELPSEKDPLTMNRLCTQGAKFIGFAMMHIYIAILAVLCFVLAFKGREKDTESIVFSMLFHLFAWLCFIPLFVTQNEQRPIIQLSAIMVSTYGVIFCHFTPKWYRILSDNAARQAKSPQEDPCAKEELQK